jgi:hypothetical protein
MHEKELKLAVDLIENLSVDFDPARLKMNTGRLCGINRSPKSPAEYVQPHS